METLLLALALSLPGVKHLPTARVHAAVRDAAAVAAVSPPLPCGRVCTARLLLTWSFFESGWHANAIGDAGHSIGTLQIGRHELPWLRVDAAHVLSSRRRGLAAGLAVMRRQVRECGSLARGLGAFAGRQCGDAQVLVSRRCRRAGVTCGAP